MERKKYFALFISLIFVLILAVMPVLTGCGNSEESTTASTGTTSESTNSATTEESSGASTEAAETTEEVKTLRIGLPVCLTGFASAQEMVQCAEAQIACDMINEDGGIVIDGQRYMIETVVEDIKSNFDGTAAAFNKLIFDEGVKYICGTAVFFNAVAAPMCNQNQVLQCAAFCTMQPGEVDETTPYTFLGYNGFVGRSMISIECLKDHYPDVDKVAVVVVDDGAIPYVTPMISNFLATQGVEIAGDVVGFANEMQDFSPIAAKLNAIEDADAVLMITGMPNHAGPIIKGYRELGNEDIPFICALVSNCADLYEIAGSCAANDLYTCAASPDDSENTPELQELIDRSRAENGEDTAIYLEYANAFWVLVHAIEAAQSLDTTEIAEYWENNITELPTLYGMGTMGGDETHGVHNHAIAHPMSTQMMLDGKQVPAGWFDFNKIP